METKKTGNSRFLVSEISDQGDNLNSILGKIDNSVHELSQVEMVNYDIHVLLSKDKVLVGRMVVGTPLRISDDLYTIDEQSGDVTETVFDVVVKTLSELIRSAKEILHKNQLKNLRLVINQGDFQRISLVTSQIGALNWP